MTDLIREFDSLPESSSDLDSDSTLCGVYGIDSVMPRSDSGNHSIALSSRLLANQESIVASARKTRAVLYARVSTDLQQKEGTIESQLATLRRQIVNAGQELVKEYIDDGYTGTLLTRPGLEQLRSDVKPDLFDVVHFLAADRIARDAAYQSIIIGELNKHG